MNYPSPAKVTELKKKLAPVVKDELKRFRQPYFLRTEVCYGSAPSWSRDVKCDQKGQRMVLTIHWNHEDSDRPEHQAWMANIQQFVADVNATIEGNLIDCPYRLELQKAEVGFCDTTDDRLTILHGQVVEG